MEIHDDDHYQLVVDQQVNEQHLLLLLLDPFQHNKLPNNSISKKKLKFYRLNLPTRTFCIVVKFCTRTAPRISIANEGSPYIKSNLQYAILLIYSSYLFNC